MSYFIDLNRVKFPFLQAKVTAKYKFHMAQPKICKCYCMGETDKLWGNDKNQVQWAIRVSQWRPSMHIFSEVWQQGSFNDMEWERAGMEEEMERPPCLKNAKKSSAGGGWMCLLKRYLADRITESIWEKTLWTCTEMSWEYTAKTTNGDWPEEPLHPVTTRSMPERPQWWTQTLILPQSTSV